MLTTLLLLALASQQTEPTPPPAKEKKICRAEQETGSRVGKRVCRTKAEWDAIADQGNRDLQNAPQRMGSANGG